MILYAPLLTSEPARPLDPSPSFPPQPPRARKLKSPLSHAPEHAASMEFQIAGSSPMPPPLSPLKHGARAQGMDGRKQGRDFHSWRLSPQLVDGGPAGRAPALSIAEEAALFWEVGVFSDLCLDSRRDPFSVVS